jgi:hypothetical protein
MCTDNPLAAEIPIGMQPSRAPTASRLPKNKFQPQIQRNFAFVADLPQLSPP